LPWGKPLRCGWTLRAARFAGWRSGRRKEALGEALAAAKGIDAADARADALAALAPHLTPDQLGEALAAAKGIDNAYWRAAALAHLMPDQLGEALAAAKRNDYVTIITVFLARPKRFELLTPRFVVWCSIQLSYGRVPSGRGCTTAGDSYSAEPGLARLLGSLCNRDTKGNGREDWHRPSSFF
jgi:hypothetical protein